MEGKEEEGDDEGDYDEVEEKDEERPGKKNNNIQNRNRMNKDMNESTFPDACTPGVTKWYRKTSTHKTHFIQTGEQSHEEMPTQTSVLNDNSLR